MDNGAVIEADDDNVASNNTGAADIAIKVSGRPGLAVNSRISGENNTQAGRGGNISLTVAGDMAMHGTAGVGTCSDTSQGALISSRRDGSGDFQPQSGDIRITVGNLGVPPTGTFTEERCATVHVPAVSSTPLGTSSSRRARPARSKATCCPRATRPAPATCPAAG